MPWFEIFAVFMVSHIVGDFVLQTQWQALNKQCGLSGPREARRALAAHAGTYMLAFVPALVWLSSGGDRTVAALLAAALIVLPHAVQDDGRLVEAYARRVKRMAVAEYPVVALLLDQSLHAVALFGVAVLIA